MLFSVMTAIRASRGMRRKRLPGTRKPLSRPLSKQRMMVCWETLQISAASPVVKTGFMVQSSRSEEQRYDRGALWRVLELHEAAPVVRLRLTFLSRVAGVMARETARRGKALLP